MFEHLLQGMIGGQQPQGLLGLAARTQPGGFIAPIAQAMQTLGSLPQPQPMEGGPLATREQVDEALGRMAGLGITRRAPQIAEQITMQGPAPALAEAIKSVQLYPQTILKHATNPLRRTPEQMAELTRAIQAEGVRPGAIQMWRMPGGGLRLVEGHHTATIAGMLSPKTKIPVSVMDAPAGQTLFK